MIFIQRNHVVNTGSDRLFVYHKTPDSRGTSVTSTHNGILLDPHDFDYYYTKFKLELVK